MRMQRQSTKRTRMKLCKHCKAQLKTAGCYCDSRCHVLAHVEKRGECWIWTGAINANGYGQIKREGKAQRAHRVSYMAFVGPIPADLQLDHTCKVRMCVNPAHLEPVTQLVNMRRGNSHKHGGGGRYHSAKTHCPQGHPYSVKNTHFYGDKRYRRCKICLAAGQRRYRKAARGLG